jgi:4-hydroxybenzoate polyprenyltransferase
VFTVNVVLALVVTSILVRINIFTLSATLVISALSMLAVALSTYVYNDFTDIEVDRINKLNRPLVTGKASPKDAKNLTVLLSVIGLTMALFVNIGFFLLMATFFILFLSYSSPIINLKRRFIINKLVVAIGTAMTTLIGASAVGIITGPIVLMFTFCFMISFSTSMLADLRDIKGDQYRNIRTPANVWGPGLTIRLAIALVCVISVATIFGYYQLGFNVAFPILSLFAFTAWIYVLYPLLRNWYNPLLITQIIRKRLVFIGFFLQMLTVIGATF